jgi:hypothetical protein
MYTKSMYIGLRQRRKIVTFSVILLSVFFAFLVYFFFIRDRSSSSLFDITPKNVILSNVWEDSVTVTWTTQWKTPGRLYLYKGSEKVGEYEDARGTKRRNTHYVNINGLEPGSIYEFEIVYSEKRSLNSDGSKFQFTTRPVLSDIPASVNANGSVNESGALIFIILDDLKESYPVAAYVTEAGNWSVDLSKIWSAYNVRDDSALKVIFYTNKGSQVFRGNKNVLFDSENNFVQEGFVFDWAENPFLNIPDVAKFLGAPVVIENEKLLVEEEKVVEQNIDESVLGIESREENRVVNNIDLQWSTLDKNNDIVDYGIK